MDKATGGGAPRQTFTDRANRAWVVTIDVQAIKDVKRQMSIDLYALIDDGAKGLAELVSDPVQLVDVLYALCRQQAETRGISDEDFGRGFSGDVLEAAADAFVGAYIDFFPNPQGRATLQRAMTKCREMGAKLLTKADLKIASIDVDQLVEELSSSFIGAPDSSDSTQAA